MSWKANEMTGKRWKVLDAVAMTVNNQGLVVPPPEVRGALKKGWIVKLLIGSIQPSGQTSIERLWVRISEVLMDGQRYQSVLVSTPKTTLGLSVGAVVEFGMNCVADYIDA